MNHQGRPLKFGREGEGVVVTNPQTPWELIQSKLDQNEILIWADAPVSIIHHAKTALPTMLFGIPFFAFSIFWINGAMESVPGHWMISEIFQEPVRPRVLVI